RAGKHDMFLSYNTRDEDRVRELHDALERLGLDVFTFREDPSHTRPMLVTGIILMLRRHLPECRSLLVVVSATSLTSNAVQLEVDEALDRDIPVLAWYPEGSRLTPERAAF